MHTHNVSYSRIGSHRDLKKASEKYWNRPLALAELEQVWGSISLAIYKLQKSSGKDLIPSNDFSFYDHVLDTSLAFGAMVRVNQQNDLDIKAMEMTKWFDTNGHYLVPESTKYPIFHLLAPKGIPEFNETLVLGIETKPVVLGAIPYLLLEQEKEGEFDQLDLIDRLFPIYLQLLELLHRLGAAVIQRHEPLLTLDQNEKSKALYPTVYGEVKKHIPELQMVLASYFNGVVGHMESITHLPVDALYLDLVRAPGQCDYLLQKLEDGHQKLSLGVVDGRNIWKTDYSQSLK